MNNLFSYFSICLPVYSIQTKSSKCSLAYVGYLIKTFTSLHIVTKSQIMICPLHLNSALGLWFFIRRGKQCLDFTVTVHFFHMIGCWVYNSHLPTSLSWWLVNVACVALMAVIGEYLCMRSELQAIPVNTGPKSNL